MYSSTGMTCTKVTSAFCSAANSSPNSTASCDGGEPSVAMTMFFMNPSFLALDATSGTRLRHPEKRGSGVRFFAERPDHQDRAARAVGCALAHASERREAVEPP